jgi:hypothetical protein
MSGAGGALTASYLDCLDAPHEEGARGRGLKLLCFPLARKAWDGSVPGRLSDGLDTRIRALECAGVIRNALECARGFSVLFPGPRKCA